MDYRVRVDDDTASVHQLAIFPFLLGCLGTLGGLTAFYLWVRDLQGAGGLDYWVPLLLCIAIVAVSLYLVLLMPVLKVASFKKGSDRVGLRERSLVRGTEQSITHAGLDTLDVETLDSDGGYWYTPVFESAEGEVLEIGFGSARKDEAWWIVHRIQSFSDAG